MATKYIPLDHKHTPFAFKYLTAGSETIENELADLWTDLWAESQSEWELAFEQIWERSEHGKKWPGRATVLKLDQVQQVLDHTQHELAKLHKPGWVEDFHSSVVYQSKQNAEAHKLMMADLFTDPAEYQNFLSKHKAVNRVSQEQIGAVTARAVKLTVSHMDKLPLGTVRQLRSALVRGVAMGSDPYEVAARFMKKVKGVFDGGRARAVNIARTEMIDALRQAAEVTQNAHADIMAGWMWSAKLDRESCIACISMHGQMFPLDIPGPLGHQSCRCARSPVTKTWEELGIPGVEDLDYEEDMHIQSGDDWFFAQSEADQRYMLGPTRYQAWVDGNYPIENWAKIIENDKWRPSFGVSPILSPNGSPLDYSDFPRLYTGGEHFPEHLGFWEMGNYIPGSSREAFFNQLGQSAADWDEMFKNASVHADSLSGNFGKKWSDFVKKKISPQEKLTQEYIKGLQEKLLKLEDHLKSLPPMQKNNPNLKGQKTFMENLLDKAQKGGIEGVHPSTLEMYKQGSEVVFGPNSPFPIAAKPVPKVSMKAPAGPKLDPTEQHWYDARLDRSFQSTAQMQDWDKARKAALRKERLAREEFLIQGGNRNFPIGNKDAPYTSLGMYEVSETINRPLRAGSTLSPFEAGQVQGMDTLFDKHAMKMKKDATVIRGVRENPKYFLKDPNDWKVGGKLFDAGYTSTSTNPNTAKGFGGSGWLMEVRIPKGSTVSPGVFSEYELILDRGAEFEILFIYNDERKVVLKYLGSSR